MQRAALTALLRHPDPEVPRLLAAALPALKADVAQRALEELVFRKDASTVEGLAAFIAGCKEGKVGLPQLALHALGVIGSARARTILEAIAADPAYAPPVRRAATQELSRPAR